MARLSISKACNIADISRTNMYKNYINTGRITVCRDKQDRPFIETSELARVFENLHLPQKTQTKEHEKLQGIADNESSKTQEILYLKQLIEERESLLAEKDKRIEELKEDKQMLFMRLENQQSHEKKTVSKKRSLFGRVVAAALEID
jgi:hypothetical protein